MDIIEFREYCLSLPMVEESTPFGHFNEIYDNILVFKVGGKMFAYADMNDFVRFAVKCDPDEAEELRARYPEVVPAHHSNKRHWNDIRTDGALTDDFLRRQILASCLLVIRKNVVPRALSRQLLDEYKRCGLTE